MTQPNPTHHRPILLIGLGNPGPRYRDTRHNVGFACIDLLSRRWNIPLNDRRRAAVLGAGHRHARPIVLAKPRTYMNLSGDAVAYLMARFGSRPHELVIIYDEMALPLGRLRLRAQGSDAGHNGIKDIIRVLHTTSFPRLRIGIGPPAIPGAGIPSGPGRRPGADRSSPKPKPVGAIAHVLGAFDPPELPIAQAAIARAADAIDCLLTDGINIAMNLYNTDPDPDPALTHPDTNPPNAGLPDTDTDTDPNLAPSSPTPP